jgi:hypothetical protein
LDDNDEDDDDDESDHSSDDEDEASEWISDQPTYGEKEDEASNQSNVRRFMKGLGEKDTLSYPDQIEVVVSFCEQACNKVVETDNVGRDTKSVALLDDRTRGATNRSDTFPVKQGQQSRQYMGPLTAQQLREELSKKVIQILSSH